MPTIRVFQPDAPSGEERKIGRTRLSAAIHRLQEDSRTVVNVTSDGDVAVVEYTVNPPTPKGAASVSPGRNHNKGGRRIDAETAVAGLKPWAPWRNH